MADSGFDLAAVGPDYVEAVLNTTELKDLQRSQMPYTVIIPDMDKYIAKIQASRNETIQYFTYQKVEETLKDYAAKYPKICRIESIGKSCENRDIWAIKISDNPQTDEKEPAVLLLGLHHSREWISTEVPMATAKVLLEQFGKDDRITTLVNEREIWIVPIVNPDGLVYSQTKQKYWRKNRRKNADGSFGVDPNRNYGYKWGDVGASDNPRDDTYHGTGPFSEPETQAVRDLAKRERFSADISFHSYSELILYPWSYSDTETAPHKELLATFAQEMAKFNKYRPQKSSDLYPSMGDTDDFMYGELKSLSFTFELARTFIPEPKEIPAICNANVPAVLHLIDKAATYGLVNPTGGEQVARLSNHTLLQAVSDLTAFSADETVAQRLDQVQKELVRRAGTEKYTKTNRLLNEIKREAVKNTAFQGILKQVETSNRFQELHSNP
jgi:murein tripeptide amidase MpaA